MNQPGPKLALPQPVEDDAPGHRDSALAFTEGVRCGWLASDLLAWLHAHLWTPGRAERPSTVRICEPGRPPLALEAPSGEGRSSAQVTQLLLAARNRVLSALREAVETRQPGFLHAALYSSRVLRTRVDRRRSAWLVRLPGDTCLSDQVLSLFAADYLEHPQDYERLLSVCDDCGAVSIRPDTPSPRGCIVHPFGAAQGPRRSTSHARDRQVGGRDPAAVEKASAKGFRRG